MKKKFRCILGFHKWEKFMGCRNVGGGKFQQDYKCRYCNKIKSVVK